MKITSISETLTFLYSLSLDQSGIRFRGQSDFSWTLQPSIYRFDNLKRYQTVQFERFVLQEKPNRLPPLTHTDFDLEWLMICQHYGVPTRLIDWTNDILIALFFACYGENEMEVDGALFISNLEDYPKFSNYDGHAMETQELAFISTNVVNPRMRTQAGCFMIWGHAPLNYEESVESYDLWQYHKSRNNPHYLKKICIPQHAKNSILRELDEIYSISYDSLYLRNGYLERTYGLHFSKLKENAHLKTLYTTDADRLNMADEKVARAMFKVDCRNMFGSCNSISKIN